MQLRYVLGCFSPVPSVLVNGLSRWNMQQPTMVDGDGGDAADMDATPKKKLGITDLMFIAADQSMRIYYRNETTVLTGSQRYSIVIR
ncbi:hypothetical protein X798_07969 [Onchocerca flexuosa]|uniref:Sen15 domain-containing protein n=2 Tax=Onchocerca flexuosa TaxID=387005 RepID=A0A183HCQ4_9BILA|nr:hypothetical protein X798_07969 [Onchocerca flexuosa]VDO42556.1 unnamed protein product [Onchocerca flexuosa]